VLLFYIAFIQPTVALSIIIESLVILDYEINLNLSSLKYETSI